MKLISMTSFVLKQNYTTTLDISQIDFYDKELSILEKIRNYANFLKQPLKLEMFVPCDEDDKLLINPFACDEDAGSEKELKQIQYNNAKEKVLFEDSVLIDETMYHQTKRVLIMLKSYPTFRIFNQFYYRDGSIERQLFPNNENLRIEDLIKFELQLTKSALKQIGL